MAMTQVSHAIPEKRKHLSARAEDAPLALPRPWPVFAALASLVLTIVALAYVSSISFQH
jgi:hypothetical protein